MDDSEKTNEYNELTGPCKCGKTSNQGGKYAAHIIDVAWEYMEGTSYGTSCMGGMATRVYTEDKQKRNVSTRVRTLKQTGDRPAL